VRPEEACGTLEHVAPVAGPNAVTDEALVDEATVGLRRRQRVIQVANGIGRIGDLEPELGERVHLLVAERCAAPEQPVATTATRGRALLPGSIPSRPPRDLLHLGVLLHPPTAALAADAALLEATERAIEHVDAVVDPHHAGADALGQLDRSRRVPGVDRAPESLGRRLPDARAPSPAPEGTPPPHRAKYPLPRDAGVVPHAAEDGRLQEVAALHAPGTAAAGGERGAPGLPRGDVLLDLLPP